MISNSKICIWKKYIFQFQTWQHRCDFIKKQSAKKMSALFVTKQMFSFQLYDKFLFFKWLFYFSIMDAFLTAEYFETPEQINKICIFFIWFKVEYQAKICLYNVCLLPQKEIFSCIQNSAVTRDGIRLKTLCETHYKTRSKYYWHE